MYPGLKDTTGGPEKIRKDSQKYLPKCGTVLSLNSLRVCGGVCWTNDLTFLNIVQKAGNGLRALLWWWRGFKVGATRAKTAQFFLSCTFRSPTPPVERGKLTGVLAAGLSMVMQAPPN
jgi:hypothetical protein